MWLDKDFKLAMIKRINKLRNAVHRQNKNLTEIKKFETRNFATEKYNARGVQQKTQSSSKYKKQNGGYQELEGREKQTWRVAILNR